MRLMYHAACKVEFQPFTRLYSQLAFFNFLYAACKVEFQPFKRLYSQLTLFNFL